MSITSQEKWLPYVRVVVSILMFLYCFVQPPYLSRLENFLCFLFLLNQIECDFLHLLVKSREARIGYLKYTLPITFAFVLVLIFFIYPFIIYKIFHRREIMSLFSRGKYSHCKELIETVNVNDLSRDELRIFIIMALHLRCENSIDLILTYNQKIHYIHEAIFLWIANSRLNSSRDMVPKKMVRITQNFENKINEDNEKFWVSVLCSNIYDLPEIASRIGRNQYRLLKFNSFLNRKFPSLIISTEIFQYNRKPKCFSFIYYVSLFDFFFLFAFCALFISHIFILSSGNQMTDFVSKFFVIRDYTTNYLLIFSDLWNNTLDPNINYGHINTTNDDSFFDSLPPTTNFNVTHLSDHWNSMMSNFSIFSKFISSYDFEPLTSLVNHFYEFIPKLVDYIIGCSIMTNFNELSTLFPHNEFRILINKLDDLFLHVNEIFHQITYKSSHISNIYFYVVVISVPSVLLVSLVIYVIYTRKRTVEFFESFRTVNKKNIIDKCKGQLFKTPRNTHFSFVRSLPALTVYLIVLVLSILVMIILLLANKYSDDFNRKHILMLTYGFSCIERNYIWLVSSITNYMFSNATNVRDYYDSFIILDDVIDNFLKNSSLRSFHSIIPADFIENIGKSLISNNIPISLEEWKMKLYESIEINNVITDNYNFISHLIFARFFLFFIINFFVYFLLSYFLLEIEPYYRWGQNEFLNKSEEAGITIPFHLQKIKDNKFPLNYYLVNEKEKIIYSSKCCSTRNSLNDIEIEYELEKLKEEKTQNYVEVKLNNKSINYIVPSYDFSTKSIKFKNALIFKINNISSEFSSEFFTKLFYTIYPSFLETGSNFPMLISTSLKPQYLLIVIKIHGFNDWSSTASNDVVCKYRQMLSQLVTERCKQGNDFSKIRETSDCIFIGMNHDQKTNTRWDLLKTSSIFANGLLRLVENLNDEFNIENKRVSIILLKTKEPQTLMGKVRMQLTDFKSDLMFQSEERADKCVSGSVVYIPLQKENIVTNASKLKSCTTSKGDFFDMWLVV